MKKNKIIIISLIISFLFVLTGVYLLLVPKLINLNSYKTQMIKEVKTQTGLGLSIENIDLKTNLNLSVDVFADKIKLNYPDDKKLISIDNASVNVPLVPLLFKNIEIKGVKVNNPEISIFREKSGKYSIESILNKLNPSSQKQDFRLVKGIDVEIKNYKLNLYDYLYKTPRNFVLSGELIKISDFNPEKYIKLETKGKLLVQNKPNINFDIKFRSELPFKMQETAENKNKSIDNLDKIIKYNFKSNIIADISLKNVQKEPDIDGFVNFDGLSLKIKDKTLPESYGKFNFKGKTFDINSKLFITPESYVSIAGKIKDIKNNKLDLSLQTTDINLDDVKKFSKALNEIALVNIKFLNNSDISGKIKADFKIKDGSDFSGYLNVLNTNITYKGISKPVKNLNSNVIFQGNRFVFDNTYGFIDNNKFDFSGFIDSKNYADLKLNINNFTVKTILDLVNQSSLLKEIKPQLKDISSLSGVIKVESSIKGKLTEKLSPEMKISMINPAFVHQKIGFPVSLTKGILVLNEKQIKINSLQADILSSPIFISGTINDYSSKKPSPEIFVKIPSFNLAKIKNLSNSKIVDKSLKKLLSEIKNPSGAVSANIKVSPENEIVADAAINNVYLYYSPSGLPVKLNNGLIKTDSKKLEIKNLNLTLSNSPLKLNGTVKSLAKLPEVDLNASGYIAAGDIKKYSSPELRKSISAKGKVPVKVSLAGYVDGWKLVSEADINNLSYIANINNPGEKLLKLNITGKPSSVSFVDSGIFSPEGKLVSITGSVSNYSGKNPVLNNIKVLLSNLNLSTIEPKGKFNLNGNVLLLGSLSRPITTGNVSVKNISVPSAYLTTDNIAFTLKNNEILVNTGLLNVLDSKFKIKMALENNFSSPVMVVKNIDVSSDYMNADKLQKAFPPVPYQDVPLIVKNGKFYAEKMLINGLQANNTSLDFVINPMNILKATNLITSAAGGTASGKINMNLKNSRISVDINTKNMEVNALATAFANTPNEIYGDMNGNISISTSGYTEEETLNNASGNIDFVVNNGKLKRLGSITNLLKAKNIFSQGFGSQVIDNILEFREASNSNQFRKLVGNISVSNGVMNINELSSQGGDMSLFSRGTLKMSNNYADITTLGTLSDRITSRLGKIPDFSIEKIVNDKLLKKIPGQWGQLISELRPKQQYPDLEKIPPLSRGRSETDRHFVVKIQGNLYKPGSVKSFKVID